MLLVLHQLQLQRHLGFYIYWIQAVATTQRLQIPRRAGSRESARMVGPTA